MSKAKNTEGKKLKVVITKPLWGKFKMPYEVGHSPLLEEKVAAELIKAGYAITEADAKQAESASDEESE